jgi:hypothetical protein
MAQRTFQVGDPNARRFRSHIRNKTVSSHANTFYFFIGKHATKPDLWVKGEKSLLFLATYNGCHLLAFIVLAYGL